MKRLAFIDTRAKGTVLVVALASKVARCGVCLLELLRHGIELHERRFALSLGILLAISELELLL